MPAAEKLQAPASAGAPRNGNVPAGAVSRDRGLFNRAILAHATVDALKKFGPRIQLRNPVMFVMLIGTVVTFAESVAQPGIFAWSVTAWLALTVLFANFAEAVAAGVDDYLAEAAPEAKMAFIKAEQEGGKLVAMTGDGTNDAPALAQADVGVAMNTGTTAAKEAGNMVDLDSNPTKLIDVVEIGKQLLITRGALTTFSIANDVAKYFAIIPALFLATYPQLRALNIMGLHSPQSAVPSAVIFNALVIVVLIPLALRGVRFRPSGAAAILRRNVFIFGVGGIIAPFIFIKLVDIILTVTGAY